MNGSPVAIALIVPSGGPEADYYGFERRLGGTCKIYMTISRVGGAFGKDHEISALKQTGRSDWVVEAAQRLQPFAPDVFSWACTSASFVEGRAGAQAQVTALEEVTGRPASSTSLAFAAAAQNHGLDRVSVLAPYPEPVSQLFAAFLRDFQVDVLSLDWLGLPSGWDVAKLQADYVCRRARQALHQEAQALLIPDTALPSLGFIEELEAALGRPVLSANAVTLWDALRLANRPMPCAGFGSLLAGTLAP